MSGDEPTIHAPRLKFHDQTCVSLSPTTSAISPKHLPFQWSINTPNSTTALPQTPANTHKFMITHKQKTLLTQKTYLNSCLIWKNKHFLTFLELNGASVFIISRHTKIHWKLLLCNKIYRTLSVVYYYSSLLIWCGSLILWLLSDFTLDVFTQRHVCKENEKLIALAVSVFKLKHISTIYI